MAVVPKTMELGCQASSMECKVLAADVDLTSSVNYNRSMPQDLKVSQIGSSPMPPPFRGLHSPGVRKHYQIIFACYFRKSSILRKFPNCVIFNISSDSRHHL